MDETLTTKHHMEAIKNLKIVHFGHAMAKNKMAYSYHERLLVT